MVLPLLPILGGAFIGSQLDKDDPMRGALIGGSLGFGGAGLLSGSAAGGGATGGLLSGGAAAPISQAVPMAGSAVQTGTGSAAANLSGASAGVPQAAPGFFKTNEDALVRGALQAAPQFLPRGRPVGQAPAGSLRQGLAASPDNPYLKRRRRLA